MLSWYAEADREAPRTPSEASDSSSGAPSDPACHVYIEVSLCRTLSGVQLERPVLYNVTRGASGHITSLGSLLALGKKHAKACHKVYSYFFQLADGSFVDCGRNVYRKLAEDADDLPPIPLAEDNSLDLRHEDSRYHRLELKQYVMEPPGPAAATP